MGTLLCWKHGLAPEVSERQKSAWPTSSSTSALSCSWKVEGFIHPLVQTHPGSRAGFAPSHVLLLRSLGPTSPSPPIPILPGGETVTEGDAGPRGWSRAVTAASPRHCSGAWWCWVCSHRCDEVQLLSTHTADP